MGRRTEHNFENLGRKVEDGDVTRMAKEAMAVSEAERRADDRAAGGPASGYDDEELRSAGDEIPPLPQAKPIPGHSKPAMAERLERHGAESPRAREAVPETGNYDAVDSHDLPNSPESKKAWPLALLSGVAGLPIAALRLAGHVASKAGCRLGVLRQRGEEKWQGFRGKIKPT